MPRAPFDNSRAKLSRARQLIAGLAEAIDKYDGAALVPHQIEPKIIGLIVKVRYRPNDTVEPLLGDIVHNLRSALDLTAVTLVQLNEGNPKGVHFPFAENAAGLDQQIINKKFNRASTEAVKLLRSLKPYRGGNLALRAVHDLDLLDKHNDLIPTYAAGVQNRDVEIGGTYLTGCSFDIEDGMRVIATRGTGAVLMRPIELKLMAQLADVQPFAGEPVVPVFNSLMELVSGIVEAFATLYAR